MPLIPAPTRTRPRVRTAATFVSAWTAVLILYAGLLHAGLLDAGGGGGPGRWANSVRRRLVELRRDRDSGLTTVEVAVITAVLLGLATALVVAITVVVNRNTSKIR